MLAFFHKDIISLGNIFKLNRFDIIFDNFCQQKCGSIDTDK